MNLVCNIDQRGRKARLISGTIVDGCGATLIVIGVLNHDMTFVVAGAIISLIGAFMIFEGALGWCAVRAMGFKTKF